MSFFCGPRSRGSSTTSRCSSRANVAATARAGHFSAGRHGSSSKKPRSELMFECWHSVLQSMVRPARRRRCIRIFSATRASARSSLKQDRIPLLLEAMAYPSIEVKIRAGRPGGRPAHQGTFDLPQRGAPRRQSSGVGSRGVASWDPATASAWRVVLPCIEMLPNIVDRARVVLTLRSGAVSRERPSPASSGAIWPRTRSDTRLATEIPPLLSLCRPDA